MQMNLKQQRDHLMLLLKENGCVVQQEDGEWLYWGEASWVPLFPDNGRPEVPPPPPVKPVS